MATYSPTAEELLTTKQESQLHVIWRRFLRHKMAVLGLFIVLGLLLMGAFSGYLTPYERDEPTADINLSPSGLHWLGTDELGRDMFTRIAFAARISLTVGFTVTFLTTLIGMTIGSVSGYFGGWVDNLAMRLVDFMLTIPSLPLLLVMSKILSSGGFIIQFPEPVLRFFGWVMAVSDVKSIQQVLYIILILALLGWTSEARLIRGVILSLREQTFTEASRALGVSHTRIITRHMIPNALAPLIVASTLSVGGVIVSEAALSFLGFGIQPPIPTWGNLLQNAQNDLWLYPWKALYPGLFIFLTSLSFNFLGDGLRDALDPRLKI